MKNQSPTLNNSVIVCSQVQCNEEVTRRVNDPNATSGFAGTVEVCFATGPLALRKYSAAMRFVCVSEEDDTRTPSTVFIRNNVERETEGKILSSIKELLFLLSIYSFDYDTYIYLFNYGTVDSVQSLQIPPI